MRKVTKFSCKYPDDVHEEYTKQIEFAHSIIKALGVKITSICTGTHDGTPMERIEFIDGTNKCLVEITKNGLRLLEKKED